MIKIFCDQCKEEIPRTVRPFEITKFKHHFCCREHRDEFSRHNGHFKKMSLAGAPGRSRVIPQSNREKPRRKKVTIIHL